MISKDILNELEDIVNKGLEDSLIPYQKGNSIRIKNIVIRFNKKKGYLIYDTDSNSQVARTQFKSCALALAKNLAAEKGDRTTRMILDLEYMLLKHYNDAIFYRHGIKNAKDEASREIKETRLDIALEETKKIRNKIDRFIFGI